MLRIAIIAMMLSAAPVLAHDAHHPELDQWYGSLTKPGSHGYEGGGVSCCSMADCHPTDAEQRDDGWWARLGERDRNGEWTLRGMVHVPQEAVINGKQNPTGEAVICHPMVWKEDGTLDHEHIPVWCFVPGWGV